MPPAIHIIGFSIIELHSVDSTNNYAMAKVHEGLAQHGLAVFAHEQTSGKGQRNKQWVTGKNQNIALSIIIMPESLTPRQLFVFNMAIALGVRRFFSQYAGDETKIKWPNDIYCRDRKAGGILIENIFKGNQWKYAVVGIGLNINQTSFEGLNHKAVSLRQITGKTYDTFLLAQELCRHIDSYYNQLLNDSDSIISQYHRQLYKLNEVVTLRKDGQLFKALIKGVNTSGQLITEQNGQEIVYASGEVEWVVG